MLELKETPEIEKGPSHLKTSTTCTSSFDFVGFSHYLQGIAGGNRTAATANSIVTDVQKFITHSSSTSAAHDNDIILRRQTLEQYFNYLKIQLQYKPTTVVEKIRRVGMAIKFMQHQSCDDKGGIKLTLRHKS